MSFSSSASRVRAGCGVFLLARRHGWIRLIGHALAVVLAILLTIPGILRVLPILGGLAVLRVLWRVLRGIPILRRGLRRIARHRCDHCHRLLRRAVLWVMLHRVHDLADPLCAAFHGGAQRALDLVLDLADGGEDA